MLAGILLVVALTGAAAKDLSCAFLKNGDGDQVNNPDHGSVFLTDVGHPGRGHGAQWYSGSCSTFGTCNTGCFML